MPKRKNQKHKAKVKNTSKTKKIPISNNINSDAIAAALSSINQPILLKVCRLCETKDGPFLNIFDPDMVTAKKIEDVMPFVIAENDDLPHKICFRCSAKVEELYDFTQKCLKTQVSLRKEMGKKGPVPSKAKSRTLWEEKLNQSNISNDDICDALIKKAMQGIKDIPLKNIPLTDLKSKSNQRDSESELVQETNERKLKLKEKDDDNDSDIPLKRIKLQKNNALIESSVKQENTMLDNEVKVKTNLTDTATIDKKMNKTDSSYNVKTQFTFNIESESDSKSSESDTFNVMDHVSTIKVNGVGILFQCKLCNRNFLKKEVVATHGCAKHGGAKKVEQVINPAPIEPPKVPVVKYITTKVVKDLKTPIIEDTINIDDDEDDKPIIKTLLNRPKAGPASKVKKQDSNLNINKENKSAAVSVGEEVTKSPEKTTPMPIIQFPKIPSLNSRYKLVSGPNNTFTLVEEGNEGSSPALAVLQKPTITLPTQKTETDIKTGKETKSGTKSKAATKKTNAKETQGSDNDKPYPVGLFQTVPHSLNISEPSLEATNFTTSTTKKQSYTIVQTGNPSKLLISTKPKELVVEVPKRKPRKAKQDCKTDTKSKEPFSVTLEDAAPPKDSGFFNFINVDPLLQPSYVLPTDTIIQEPRISTSTNIIHKEATDKNSKYTCNMCNEKFTKEKKLLLHIQSHYKEMDKEDQERNGAAGTAAKNKKRNTGLKKSK